ncbi:MAG: helix-turn-helix transcriptional regulator [Cytophagaceae bacterium]|nr:helix-turn-helix transcriptional regulator [Cytophagaceae bacterium]MBK9932697.1 helix-turn-helix transcriptional regulator [Cytophagaceae bacterium]MBL0303612.1 helix-turn-helix transcriptional regulator [Cytophagaceae bacterium]MBL0326441.1 helix-turn-helix transcriptional regulator [Cytophagaceae bacterium]
MDKMILLTIGKNLRKLRLFFGYSQQELSYILDVTQTTYSKWESDLKTPTIRNLIKVSQLYKIPLEDLVYDQLKFDHIQRSA